MVTAANSPPIAVVVNHEDSQSDGAVPADVSSADGATEESCDKAKEAEVGPGSTTFVNDRVEAVKECREADVVAVSSPSSGTSSLAPLSREQADGILETEDVSESCPGSSIHTSCPAVALGAAANGASHVVRAKDLSESEATEPPSAPPTSDSPFSLTGSTIETRRIVNSRHRPRDKRDTLPSAEAPPPPVPAIPHEPHLHSLAEAYATYLQHDDDETQHFHNVCRAYRQYSVFAVSQWMNQQSRVFAAASHSTALVAPLSEPTSGPGPHPPLRYLQLLPPALVDVNSAAYQKRVTAYKEAAIRNQFVCDCILRHAGQAISQEVRLPSSKPAEGDDTEQDLLSAYATDADISKVREYEYVSRALYAMALFSHDVERLSRSPLS
jgi:hypothetical protein